jgi:tetratricopeptide (TPR) repeat protein
VYLDQQRPDAAEIAFTRAIQKNPRRWQAYYALGTLFVSKAKQQYGNAILTSDHILRLRPGLSACARVHVLRGLAHRELARTTDSDSVFDELDHACKSFRRAVAFSWRALCRAYLKRHELDISDRREIEELEGLAGECLRQLALAHAARADLDRSGAGQRARRWASLFFRQAHHLTYANPAIYREAARLYHGWGRFSDAHDMLVTATRIYPDDVESWALLARNHLAHPNRRHALRAAHRAIEVANFERVSDSLPAELARVLRACGRHRLAHLVWRRKRLLRRWEGATQEDVAAVEKAFRCAERNFARGTGEDAEWLWRWEAGYAAYTLGRLATEGARWKEAAEWYQQSLRFFEGKYRREIRRRGVQAALALPLRYLHQHQDALQQVETAIRLDPLAAYERLVQGDVLFAFHDYPAAEDVWCNALLHHPQHPDRVYRNIGIARFNSAVLAQDPERRVKAMKRAARAFNQALRLCGNTADGWIQFWLGRTMTELSRFGDAIPHYHVSAALRFAPITSTYCLGEAQMQVGAWEDAATSFDHVEKECLQLRAAGKQLGEKVEEELGDASTIGELLTMARWGRATLMLRREVDLNEALASLVQAESELSGEAATPALRRCRAALARCAGEIQYTRGRVDAAIRELKNSLRLSPDPEAFLLLARAYERKLHTNTRNGQNWVLQQQALRHCDRVIAMDLRNQFATEARALRARLQKWETEALPQVQPVSSDGTVAAPSLN